jgi:hypothetical protein
MHGYAWVIAAISLAALLGLIAGLWMARYPFEGEAFDICKPYDHERDGF